MKRLGIWCTWLVLFFVMGMMGCSDDTESPNKEAGAITEKGVDKKDGLGLPDGYTLWACEDLGKSCNAHDPCAIDPICKKVGGALKCVPSSLQDCGDGLACTTDTCAGLGVCTNTPKTGWCALAVKVTGNKTCGQVRPDSGVKTWDTGTPDTGTSDTGTSDFGAADASSSPDAATQTSKTIICCFKAKDRHPTDQCLVCTPTPAADTGLSGNSSKWSPANGGACDDFKACTKNDYCQNGQCTGTYYGNTCQDSLSCTKDICDGKGGCVGNKLMSNYCLINGVCYKDSTKHPGGSCYVCDVKKSQSNWSNIGNSCFIGGKCYKPGEKDSTKCGECDPKKSTTAWTMLTGNCKINGICYKKGDQHSGKCAECDPTTSTTGWTVKGSFCVINYVCKKPKDLDTTGCSTCDPTKNKYAWTQMSGKCKIAGKCYTTGTLDSTNCGKCDPTKSSTSWTPLTGKCLIVGKCYTTGTLDSTNCGKCDPTKSSTSWTPLTGKCKIASNCYSSGTLDSTNCGKCDPTKSSTSWTPLTGKCMISGSCLLDKAKHSSACMVCDHAKNSKEWTGVAGVKTSSWGFEKGSTTGWSISNSSTSVGWQAATLRATSGSYALYYGNPTAKNYDTSGSSNSGSATSPSISLTAGKKAGLSFMIWMYIESTSSYDKITVTVNSDVVYQKPSLPTMSKWTPVYIDLAKYAGKSISVKFAFDTQDSVANTTEGIYIDEIYVHHGC